MSSQASSPAFQDQRPFKRVRIQAPSSGLNPTSHEELVEDFEAEDDSLNEVVMALDQRSRDTIGCCYYSAREDILYLMNDTKYGDLDIIDSRGLKHLSLEV